MYHTVMRTVLTWWTTTMAQCPTRRPMDTMVIMQFHSRAQPIWPCMELVDLWLVQEQRALTSTVIVWYVWLCLIHFARNLRKWNQLCSPANEVHVQQHVQWCLGGASPPALRRLPKSAVLHCDGSGKSIWCIHGMWAMLSSLWSEPQPWPFKSFSASLVGSLFTNVPQGLSNCPSADSCRSATGCRYTTPQSYSRNLVRVWSEGTRHWHVRPFRQTIGFHWKLVLHVTSVSSVFGVFWIILMYFGNFWYTTTSFAWNPVRKKKLGLRWTTYRICQHFMLWPDLLGKGIPRKYQGFARFEV